MIQFNELRIVDGKLIIDVSVKDLPYYENVTVESILIDNQNTLSPVGPSDNAFSVHNVIEGKAVHVELQQQDFIGTNFSIDNDLFFVYAVAGGIPSSETPCGMDNCFSSGAVTNLTRLYKKGMSYIKELANSCEVPVGFTDFILKYKAFVLSIKACDFLQAIKFWKKFFSNEKIVTKGCGCHGGYNS